MDKDYRYIKNIIVHEDYHGPFSMLMLPLEYSPQWRYRYTHPDKVKEEETWEEYAEDLFQRWFSKESPGEFGEKLTRSATYSQKPGKKDKTVGEFLRDTVIFLIILGILWKIFFSIGLIWPLLIFLFIGIAVVGIRHNVW